jgi:hypothetical protein
MAMKLGLARKGKHRNILVENDAGPMRELGTEGEKNFIISSFIILTHKQYY